MQFVKSLHTGAGGDWPEATKSGLAKAYEVMRPEATTLILHYADAPPHTFANGKLNDSRSYLGHEQNALSEEGAYGGFGGSFKDWVSVGRIFGKQDGGEGKRGVVFSILDGNRGNTFPDCSYYNCKLVPGDQNSCDNANIQQDLTTVTGGACIYLSYSKPSNISLVTVELLLSWMGVSKPGSENAEFPGFFTRYISIKDIKFIKDESDPAANAFFPTPSFSPKNSTGPKNITRVKLSSNVLKQHLPKKQTPVEDFGMRYKADKEYKKLAIDEIRKLIAEDVSAISLNSVFGSLWRTICNDRSNKTRQDLVTSFGREVEKIDDAAERARMKLWLGESYDYTADVLEIIDSIPEAQRFPCICLDPTLKFSREQGDDEEDEESNRPITKFRRDELLEIGRSCDYRILRRLGKVLTRLTYVNSAAEMPAHIANAVDVHRVPIALANEENKRQFWKILLHVVVPGTILSARPAALLAALSIHLGIQPLLEAADREVMIWRDRWNDLEVPETWSVRYVQLLIFGKVTDTT